METQSKMKKVLNVLKTIVVWLILVLSVLMMVFTIISTTMFDNADKNLFGYKFMVVLSDSMSATHFDAGDVIIVKEVDLKTLEPGDIISFYAPLEDGDEEAVKQQYANKHVKVVTHMIKTVTKDADGNIAFETYGTTKGPENVDRNLATMIIGEYQMHIPKLGYFFQFVGTIPGYIVCILVPFVLLILSQAINCVRLFRRYRAEQMAGLVEEREKLEAEREENRRMMEELMALKAQMAAGGVTAQAPPETPAAPEATAEAPKVAEAPIDEAPVEEAPAIEASTSEAENTEG